MNILRVLKRFGKAGLSSTRIAVVSGRRGVHVAQVQMLAVRPQVVRCDFYSHSSVGERGLEEVRKQAGLERAQCTTLMETNDYALMQVESPNVPQEELKTAARWKIKDMVPYPIDDASVEILQIPGNRYGGEGLKSLYVVCAPNTAVRKCIRLFEEAQLELQVIDIPELAQRNAAALFEQEGRGLAFLSFSDDGGLLTISCDGELFLARHIEITLGQLQDANENLRQQYIDRVELETQRSLDYFDRQFHQIPVTRMMLSIPEGEELAQKLAENLGLPVERMDLTQVLDCSAAPKLSDGEFASHALLAIGAALRQEKKAL